MASSVASAKEMERWRRERELEKATKVEMPDAARKGFHSMAVDMEQLAKFERKAHKLVDRQEAKANELEVEPIINVMGSTAGAGSGDFHTYRGYRAKEVTRLKDFEEERKEEAAKAAWEKERQELAAEQEARASKRADKRVKKKAKRKANAAAGSSKKPKTDEGGEGDEEEEDDDDVADPLAAAAGTLPGDAPGTDAISGGFEWDDFAAGGEAQREATSKAKAKAPKEGEKEGRRERKLKERKAALKKEAAVAQREQELLDDSSPQSAEAFERLLLGSPNSSYLWLRYMSFQLSLTEIERAREVAERALKKIDLREQRERFNVWAALLNLEKAHGDEASFVAVFQRALQGADPKEVHLHVASTHERAGDIELTDAAYEAACKKFKQSADVWGAWMASTMTRGEGSRAKEILQRAINVLPTAQHVNLISKFGQLEFRHGSAERGRTVFDGVLANYPKRVDIWSVYIDMELRQGDDEPTRRLLERVTSLRLSSKKMKFFFSRYLTYARDAGDDALVAQVKEKARVWVENATKADDD